MDVLNNYFHDLIALISKPLFNIGENPISISSVVIALLIIGVFSKLSNIAEKWIRKVLEPRQELDTGVKGAIERFTRYIVFALGIFISLDSVGISLSSLAAIGAALMVGIGFGLQNITQNFISGLILLFERPIKRGDIISVDGVEGVVEDVNARSTLVLTRDEIAILVPNSKFISEPVTNLSYSSEQIRIHIKVGVAYGSNTALVKDLLLKVAAENSNVLKKPEPIVLFVDFGESSLDFDLILWVNDLWFQKRIASEIRFAIDDIFRKNNVEIPFPQRDLHVRSSDLKQFN